MYSGRVPNRTQDILQQSLLVALVLGGAFGLLLLSTATSLRNFAIIAAVALVAVTGLLSGNPKLFCLWGLMLTVPLSLSKRFGPMFLGKAGGEDSFRLEVSDLFWLPLLAFILWDMVKARRKGIHVPKPAIPYMMLIGIGVIWVIVGPWRTTAAQECVRMTKLTILYVVVANFVDSPRRAWHCGAGLAAGAILEGVIALIEYGKHGLIGLQVLGETSESTIQVLAATSVHGVNVFRPSALLQHANDMGMYFAVLLPICIALLLVSRSAKAKAFFIAAIALACPGVVISLSRSAWVAATLSVTLVLIFMPLHPKLRWRSAKVIGMVGLVGLVVGVGLSGPILRRALDSKDNSTLAREMYKEDARRMIDAAPWFGHGLNSYVFELPKYTNIPASAYAGHPPAVHEIFYLWWAETGIFGMLLWCAVWGSIIWMGFTNLSVKDEVLYAVNAAALSAEICFIPDAFLSWTLRVNTMLRMFWVMAGLIAAVRYMRFREHRMARLRRASNSVAVGPPASAPEPVPNA